MHDPGKIGDQQPHPAPPCANAAAIGIEAWAIVAPGEEVEESCLRGPRNGGGDGGAHARGRAPVDVEREEVVDIHCRQVKRQSTSLRGSRAAEP